MLLYLTNGLNLQREKVRNVSISVENHFHFRTLGVRWMCVGELVGSVFLVHPIQIGTK